MGRRRGLGGTGGPAKTRSCGGSWSGLALRIGIPSPRSWVEDRVLWPFEFSSKVRRSLDFTLACDRGYVQGKAADCGGLTSLTRGSTSAPSRRRRRNGCWRRSGGTATSGRSSPASSLGGPTTPSRTTGTSSWHVATVKDPDSSVGDQRPTAAGLFLRNRTTPSSASSPPSPRRKKRLTTSHDSAPPRRPSR